jgi:circadian clock protein KaiC
VPANGEPGVIASLQRTRANSSGSLAASAGRSTTSGGRHPLDAQRCLIDERIYELLELIETTGATRVMIDSLSDLQYATPDPARFREFIYSLTQRLSRAGIARS